jgi:hypothetical protein
MLGQGIHCSPVETHRTIVQAQAASPRTGRGSGPHPQWVRAEARSGSAGAAANGNCSTVSAPPLWMAKAPAGVSLPVRLSIMLCVMHLQLQLCP